MGLLFRLLLRAAPLIFFMLLARAAGELFRPFQGRGRTYNVPPPPGGAGPRRAPGPTRKKTPYEVLGCSPSASDDEIKRRYRELLAKYHPDKFIGQNLDEEFVELASRKFQEIQEAYDALRTRRGF
ncbi:MAG: J domain-containing protein [Aminivibrio sp.]|jgi:DnaJ-domain-containing protein 1